METSSTKELLNPRTSGEAYASSNEAYSVDEAAKICRCEPETLVVRIELGDIPGLKIGRGWIIPCEAFKQRLNELALEEALTRRRLRKEVPTNVRAILTNSSKNGRSRVPPILPAMPVKPIDVGPSLPL